MAGKRRRRWSDLPRSLWESWSTRCSNKYVHVALYQFLSIEYNSNNNLLFEYLNTPCNTWISSQRCEPSRLIELSQHPSNMTPVLKLLEVWPPFLYLSLIRPPLSSQLTLLRVQREAQISDSSTFSDGQLFEHRMPQPGSMAKWSKAWARSRRAPVQVLSLLTFWLIALDEQLSLCPCSASSVNWYQLAEWLAGGETLCINAVSLRRASQGHKAVCNPEICLEKKQLKNFFINKFLKW